MATFSNNTENDITRASSVSGSRTGWADAVGGAIEGVGDELGDASLANPTEGNGDLLRGNSEDKLNDDQLPDIPAANLPLGDGVNQIPVIQSNGRISSSILPSQQGPFDIDDDKLTLSTFTSDGTWAKPDNLRYVVVRMVGGGGRAGSDDGDTYMAVGYRSYPKTFIIPAFLLTDSVSVVVGAADTSKPNNNPTPSSGGDSAFGDLARVSGGLTLNYTAPTGSQNQVNYTEVAQFFGSQSITNDAFGGMTGVSGQTNPTAEVEYHEGVRPRGGIPASGADTNGFGSPNINGIVLVWAVRV